MGSGVFKSKARTYAFIIWVMPLSSKFLILIYSPSFYLHFMKENNSCNEIKKEKIVNTT